MVPPGAHAHGLRLVGEAAALGVGHVAHGESRVGWGRLVDKVHGRYRHIAALHLYVFGRGMGTAAYGLSKVMYAIEFVGMPPAAVMDQLTRSTAKLVDRGRAPEDTTRAFACVMSDLLVGNTKHGGCGAMPLRQHITARHPQWCLDLVCGSPSTTWIHVA